MCDAVNPLPVREQGNDENEYHKDKDWGEHVPGITLDFTPDVLDASLSAQQRRHLVLEVRLLRWTSR